MELTHVLEGLMAVRTIDKNQMVLKRTFVWTHTTKVVEN